MYFEGKRFEDEVRRKIFVPKKDDVKKFKNYVTKDLWFVYVYAIH
jgi:hypothetical protein